MLVGEMIKRNVILLSSLLPVCATSLCGETRRVTEPGGSVSRPPGLLKKKSRGPYGHMYFTYRSSEDSQPASDGVRVGWGCLDIFVERKGVEGGGGEKGCTKSF